MARNPKAPSKGVLYAAVGAATAAVGVVGVGLYSLISNDKSRDEQSNSDSSESSPHNNSSLHASVSPSQSRRHSQQQQPIYVEIAPQAEEYLKTILNPQLGHQIIPSLPMSLSECNIGTIEPSILCEIFTFLPIETLLTIANIEPIFDTIANSVLHNRTYLRNCARRGFMNRQVVWPWIVAPTVEGFHDLYVRKLIQWRQVESGEIDADRFVRSLRALSKDIHRTFSNNRLLQLTEEQRRQLSTLLGVYSLLDPDVGYVQGMNFLAGVVVLAITDELDAFAIFCQLMKLNHSPPCDPTMYNLKLNTKSSFASDSTLNQNFTIRPSQSAQPMSASVPTTPTRTPLRNFTHSHCGGGRSSKTGQSGYGMRYLFTECLPGCVIGLLQLEQSIQKTLPRLYQQMRSEGLDMQSFAAEWFMTMFSYVLPLPITFRVYDLFLVDGWKVLHRVGLAILSRCEEYLLSLSLDDMLMYLKQFPDSGIFINSDDEECGDSFIEYAMTFPVTNGTLHLCATNLLAKTMVQNRIQHCNGMYLDTDSEWTHVNVRRKK